MKRKIWHTDNIIRGRLIEIGRRVPYAEIQMPTAKIGKMRAECFIDGALDKIQRDYYNGARGKMGNRNALTNKNGKARPPLVQGRALLTGERG